MLRKPKEKISSLRLDQDQKRQESISKSVLFQLVS